MNAESFSTAEPPTDADPDAAAVHAEATRSLRTVPLDLAERRALLEGEVRSVYRSTAAALAVPLILVSLLVGIFVGWMLGLALLVVSIALVVALVAWRRSGAVTAALNALGARRLRAGENARYANLIEGLAMSSGVAEPRLYVVDDPRANAATVALGDDACVVVTSGLLDAADRMRLEAVLAQQVAHLAGGDAQAATAAHAFRTSVGWRYELDRLLPARREELCDLNALEFTRYPPGLISALELIAEMGPAGSDGDPAVSHLWMAAPDEFQVNNAAQVTIARRLALLNEL